MTSPSVVVLGGGVSGMAAAYALAQAGLRDVTLVEGGRALGGLAGSFERQGCFYPLGYHHILDRSQTLLRFLELTGALPRVRWRNVSMLFRAGGRLYDLATVPGFLRFPMRKRDKLRFAHLMLRAGAKADWSDWSSRSAAELVDAWGGPRVREALFEPLTQLKFGLPCAEVSAAWLGARLYFREGRSPLGYIPGANWTKVLCDGMERLCVEAGVHVLTRARVRSLETQGRRVHLAELEDGTRIGADRFLSTLPTPVYGELVHDDTPHLRDIRYTALLSAVCATRQAISPDFYWMNITPPGHTACAIFDLSSLNPTIGAPGERCVNFVTHLRDRSLPAFTLPDDALLDGYRRDFRAIFGADLEAEWTHLARVPYYSPVFVRGYRNPPARSARYENVFFAGNYRTFPSIASIGTAIESGLEAARIMTNER